MNEKSDVSTMSINDVTNEKDVRQSMIGSTGRIDTVYLRKLAIPDIKIIEDSEYLFRVAISQEVTLRDTNPDVANFNKYEIKSKRNKKRRSVILNSFRGRLDISEVTTTNYVKDERGNKVERDMGQSYEVELEFQYRGLSSFNEDYTMFTKGIFEIRRILNGSDFLYKTSELNKLYETISRALTEGSPAHSRMDKYFVQIRALKAADLVYGGLVGNQRVVNHRLYGTRYTAAWKVDGERYLLAIDKTGYWLLSPSLANEEFNLIWRSAETSDEYSLTMFDGELVPFESRLQGIPPRESVVTNSNDPIVGDGGVVHQKYWYIPFDCLVVNNSNLITERNHLNRISQARSIAYINNSGQVGSVLYITLKTFVVLNNPADFYFHMRAMLNKRDSLTFREDGIVFTPEDCGYLPSNQDLKDWTYKFGPVGSVNYIPMKDRVLTKYPDGIKWKPSVTIDFRWKWRNPHKTTYELIMAGDIVFRGDDFVPFNGEVDFRHALLQDIDSKTVVEFEWILRTDPRYPKGYDFKATNTGTDGMFVPKLLRPRKTDANSENTVKGNWRQIHDQISEQVLTGRNFYLLFKYHNRIKRMLYDSVRGPRKLRLLDIGSGVGGTVSSWHGFSSIVAVEPDLAKHEELKRRLSINNLSDQTTVVGTGGEDSKTIRRAVEQKLGGKADVISLMLSMSFFWQSPDILNGLITTIKENLAPGGKVIFLTIDGQYVDEVYNELLRANVEVYPQLSIGPAVLQRAAPKTGSGGTSGEVLVIDIPGSIVKKQQEYLVNVEQFYSLLGAAEQFQYRVRATTERFLSPNETLFSSMYSFGIISPGSPPWVPVGVNLLATVSAELGVPQIPSRFGSLIPSDRPTLMNAILQILLPGYLNLTINEQLEKEKTLRKELVDVVDSLNRAVGVTIWEMAGYTQNISEGIIQNKRKSEIAQSTPVGLKTKLLAEEDLNISHLPLLYTILGFGVNLHTPGKGGIAVDQIGAIHRRIINLYYIADTNRWYAIVSYDGTAIHAPSIPKNTTDYPQLFIQQNAQIYSRNFTVNPGIPNDLVLQEYPIYNKRLKESWDQILKYYRSKLS
jgi:hypothetical protein